MTPYRNAHSNRVDFLFPHSYNFPVTIKKEGKLNQVKKSKGKLSNGEGHLFGVRILEKLYDLLKGLLNEKVLQFSTTWAGRIGHWALV